MKIGCSSNCFGNSKFYFKILPVLTMETPSAPSGESVTEAVAAAPATGDAAPPKISKNQLKRQRRQERWEKKKIEVR